MKTVIPDFTHRAGEPFKVDPHWMQERSWFGYTSGFRELVLKKSLPPSSLSIVYSLPVDMVLERIRILILNAILLNVLVGIVLFTLARMYERKIFIPAENDAQRMEEHEQFNRKIVASAPVGICILRTRTARTSSVTSWHITT
jgi:two-component system capsular synthesis sensor histidine kinase RcsC